MLDACASVHKIIMITPRLIDAALRYTLTCCRYIAARLRHARCYYARCLLRERLALRR